MQNSSETSPSRPYQVAILKSYAFKNGEFDKSALQLIKGFLDRGCEVSLLTTGDPHDVHHQLNQLDGLEFEIVNFGLPSKIGFLRLSQFDHQCQEWLKKHPCDLVFGIDRNTHQTHYRALHGVHAEYLEKRKQFEHPLKAISFKVNPLHRLILKYEKMTFENPDLQVLFANSNMVADEIQKHYNMEGKKIEVIHNGVDWEEKELDFKEWDVKQVEKSRLFGLDPCSFQFLFIGNDYQKSGLSFLLEGLARLNWKNFQLSIVGKDAQINRFQILAENLGLKHKVKFFGPLHDLTSFYQIADCVVIPSVYEPFSNTTLEGMAMGNFILSSRHNGGHEILTPDSGVVIENLFDPDAVNEALKVAVKHPKNPQRAWHIRQQVKSFDISNQIQKMIVSSLAVVAQ